MTLDEKMKSLGVRPVYYRISSYGDVRTTVCLLCSKGEVIARGISICSLSDVFSKKIGRDKAAGRAIKALINRGSSEPINTNRYFPSTEFKLSMFAVSYVCNVKSCFAPALTDLERSLTEKVCGVS